LYTKVATRKRRWAPAFVRTGHEAREGNTALVREGLSEISDAWLDQAQSIRSLFDATMDAQDSLPLFSTNELAPAEQEAEECDRDILFKLFREQLLSVLDTPLATSKIAERFGLEASQAEVWLQRAADAGILEVTANQQWRRPSP
jgi:predicted Rossmann fold nucleotide-binding protein DprA/Smf involved in DNA uptake